MPTATPHNRPIVPEGRDANAACVAIVTEPYGEAALDRSQ